MNIFNFYYFRLESTFGEKTTNQVKIFIDSKPDLVLIESDNKELEFLKLWIMNLEDEEYYYSLEALCCNCVETKELMSQDDGAYLCSHFITFKIIQAIGYRNSSFPVTKIKRIMDKMRETENIIFEL